MPTSASKVIAVDFDGTCVTHEYPDIGKDIGAVPVLKDLVKAGHRLVLWTMRSGESLDAAVAWFAEHDIPLFGINKNPDQKAWTKSPKAYAMLYIDDAALGAPFRLDPRMSDRPFIVWEDVRSYLVTYGYLAS